MVSVMIGNRRRLNNTINDLLQFLHMWLYRMDRQYKYSFISFVGSYIFFFLSLLLFRFGSFHYIDVCVDAYATTAIWWASVRIWRALALCSAGPICMIHFFCHGHEWQFRYTDIYLYTWRCANYLPYALRLRNIQFINGDRNDWEFLVELFGALFAQCRLSVCSAQFNHWNFIAVYIFFK